MIIRKPVADWVTFTISACLPAGISVVIATAGHAPLLGWSLLAVTVAVEITCAVTLHLTHRKHHP